MEPTTTDLQEFFTHLGEDDQFFAQFKANPMAVIAGSDLSNNDKWFLLTMGPANSADRVVYSFNFTRDQITPKPNTKERIFELTGNQYNIQKGDRILLPHVIDGWINLDTFEMIMNVRHGVIEGNSGDATRSAQFVPDTSVVHTFTFNKDDFNLLGSDFVILGTQHNIDDAPSDPETETACAEETKILPHRINGSFSEGSLQLSINVFLDNPDA